jgi:hypothetical protein
MRPSESIISSPQRPNIIIARYCIQMAPESTWMTHYTVQSTHTLDGRGGAKRNDSRTTIPLACDSEHFIIFQPALMLSVARSNISVETDELLKKRCALDSVLTLKYRAAGTQPVVAPKKPRSSDDACVAAGRASVYIRVLHLSPALPVTSSSDQQCMQCSSLRGVSNICSQPGGVRQKAGDA